MAQVPAIEANAPSTTATVPPHHPLGRASRRARLSITWTMANRPRSARAGRAAPPSTPYRPSWAS